MTVGTYHTFFVANDGDLDRLFPGWKPVKPMDAAATTPWEPVSAPAPLGKPNLYDDVWGPPAEPVSRQPGEWAQYARMIEEAGAPGLRALPHFRSKNVEPLYDFEGLVSVLFGGPRRVPPARLGNDRDDDVTVVFRLPRDAAAALIAVEPSAQRTLVTRLLEETDLGTSDIGDEAQAQFITHVLEPLLALCREAEARGGEVCHYYALHY